MALNKLVNLIGDLELFTSGAPEHAARWITSRMPFAFVDALDKEGSVTFDKLRWEAFARLEQIVFSEKFPQSLENCYAVFDEQIDTARLTQNARLLLSASKISAAARGLKDVKFIIESSLRLHVADDVFASITDDIADVDKKKGHTELLKGTLEHLAEKNFDNEKLFAWARFFVTRGAEMSDSATVSFAALSADGGAGLNNFTAYRSNDSAQSLVEYPYSALLAFDEELLKGVERAWEAAGRDSIIWRVEDKFDVLAGNSLEAAAAVAMLRLRQNKTGNADTLIAACLDEQNRLLPVVGEIAKCKAAHSAETGKIILSGRRATADSAADNERENEEFKRELIGNGIEVDNLYFAETLENALEFADKPAITVYLGRYETPKRQSSGDASFYTSAQDRQHPGERRLLFIKPQNNAQVSELIRAWWEATIRTLYQFTSAARSEDYFLTLSGADYDPVRKSFVIAFKSNDELYAYTPLERIFPATTESLNKTWLTARQLSDKNFRSVLWSGLQNLAAGLDMLHRAGIIHRNVVADRVFYSGRDNDDNIETIVGSWRLGGIEDCLRFGDSFVRTDARQQSKSFSILTDWYDFGILAIRLFACLPPRHFDTQSPPEDMYKYFTDALKRANWLNDDAGEKEFLVELINPDETERAAGYLTIDDRITKIKNNLKHSVTLGGSKKLGLVFFNTQLNKYIIPALFPPEERKTVQHKYSDDAVVVARAIDEEFENAVLGIERGTGLTRGGFKYMLVGKKLKVRIESLKERQDEPENTDERNNENTWSLAVCVRNEEEYSPLDWIKLPTGSVKTVYQWEINPRVKQQCTSWKGILPMPRATSVDKLDDDLLKLHSQIRLANELELLLRNSEIYPYEFDNAATDPANPGVHILKERSKPNVNQATVSKTVKPQTMIQAFAVARQSSGGIGTVEALITDEPVMSANYKQHVKVTVLDADESSNRLSVRLHSDGERQISEEGYIRLADHYGQVDLIRRRKEAIDKLKEHSFLLQTLTGDLKKFDFYQRMQFSPPYTPDVKLLHDTKHGALTDIFQTRPIYALQGPPGTGKTTLVSWLLRAFLQSHSFARLLVTSQGHAAVDVLLDKVEDFDLEQSPLHGLQPPPIIVRLGGSEKKCSPEKTTEALMQQTHGELEAVKENETYMQSEWRALLADYLDNPDDIRFSNLRNVLEHTTLNAASVTFATMSDSELEQLLKEETSRFDFCILEEAGKAHLFDIVLPMLLAHRWMLLGDHKQLQPYRYETFFRPAIEDLDQSIKDLLDLPNDSMKLRDRDWLQSWVKMWEQKDKDSFAENLTRRTKIFETLFNDLQNNPHVKPLNYTTNKAIGALVGKLELQWRMHPTIGTLISNVFYWDDDLKTGTLKNASDDGLIDLDKLRHKFTTPAAIGGKSVVWINTPYGDDRGGDFKQTSGRTSLKNIGEALVIRRFLEEISRQPPSEDYGSAGAPIKVSVLAPYTLQVSHLANELKNFTTPEWMALTKEYGSPEVISPELSEQPKTDTPVQSEPHAVPRSPGAYTVDSFQGNEAKVVVVSLTRNNDEKIEQSKSALGFVKEPERLNVMLSRAEHLLVIVGSWHFFQRHTKDERDTGFEHLTRLRRHLLDLFGKDEAVMLDTDFNKTEFWRESL